MDQFWNAYWKGEGKSNKLGWRLEYNMKNRGDVYATHGLGPVAQALDIHRGDRMRTLIAMDTKSFNGKAEVEKVTEGAKQWAKIAKQEAKAAKKKNQK